MAKKPLIIGLTGGIGSGKSTVAEQFAALGIVSVDADQASRAVVEPGMPALDYIEERFGLCERLSLLTPAKKPGWKLCCTL